MLTHKYRPSRLSEVVGQEILVKTLLRSLEEKKIPHALLFHGMRGVGKTTVARIVAKALNCVEETSIEPCGLCSSCQAITEGRFLDVMELDAASHTSVEDVREIIEAARYKAVLGRFKVYIIDEVHMLSKSAFNALLKTLEEPPPNVVFILATTELRRVPETVISRCMRFDLKRIAGSALQSHLITIANREDIILAPAAAQLLAQAADGSLRDALSLLDQAIALNGSEITSSHIQKMLGVVNRISLIAILQSFLSGIVTSLDDSFPDGVDAYAFLEGLLDTVYNLICLKTMPEFPKKLLWEADEITAACALCAQVTLPTLIQTWQVLSQGQGELTKSTHPHQALDMILVRLAYLSPLPSAHDLLKAVQENQPSVKQECPTPKQPTPPKNLLQDHQQINLEHPIVQEVLKAFPGATPNFSTRNDKGTL